MIRNLIDIEASYINTSHPDFLGAEESMVNLFEEGSSNKNNVILSTQSSKNNYDQIKSKMKLENDLIEEDYTKIKNERIINYINSNQFQMRAGQPNNKELMETNIIKNLISSYFQVVKKSICDYVPKTIMCFLVNQSKIVSEKELVFQLYNSEEMEELLEENQIIANKRKNCKEILKNLKKSLESLNEIKDLKMD